ncbi:MAG: TIGR02186 family protein [Desulfobulbaceae bacterium]|nr:TIGR02186 family protein [Desulfobulbaceae bacterium]
MTLLQLYKINIGARAMMVCAALVLVLGGVAESFALTCVTTPDKVDIGMSYHGAKLVVSGQSKADDELIVKITAPNGESHLKFKGKAANLFWMKMGSMVYSEVPAVYMLSSTSPVDKMLLTDQLNENKIGYPALESHVKIESDKMEVEVKQWFDEFIRFKEKDNLYSVREGAVNKTIEQDGATYKLELDWPYQATPGEYSVEVLAVRDGKIMEKAQSTITVARAGVVAQLSDLAFNNAALYGVMAIVIALVAGFGVGAVFKGGGSH